MNLVVISGNLTADPELRYLPSGAGVASFNVAVSRTYAKDGESKEEVSFLGVTAFGKQAETISQYFKKGKPILVQGRLKQESWDDKTTGKKQYKTGIVMESFEFMSKKSDSDPTPAAVQVQKELPKFAPKPEQDDVPF